MSDPVTNEQVEDVLSSIRRLVSDEKRPVSKPKAVGDGRLVLTPALRVTDPKDSGPLDLGTVAEESWPPAKVVAEKPQEDSWEDEGDHSTEAFWESSEGQEVEADAAIQSAAEVLTGKIAALEEAIGSIQQEFEPDEPGMGANSGTEAPSMNWEDDLEFDATGKPLHPVREPDRDSLDSSSGTESEREEGTAIASEGVEPTFLPRHSYERLHAAAATEAMTEVSTQEIAPTPLEAKAPFAENYTNANETENALPEDASPADSSSNDDHLLDEEALREMIGQIVRAELQGALGERITRNVRKLVRREIYRALAAQDLD